MESDSSIFYAWNIIIQLITERFLPNKDTPACIMNIETNGPKTPRAQNYLSYT